MNQCQIIGRQMLFGDSGAMLPAAYQEVEWIASSGNEYIDTNILGSNLLDIDIKIRMLSNISLQRIFGGYSEESKRYELYYSGGSSYGYGFNYAKKTYSGSYENPVNIDVELQKTGLQYITPFRTVKLELAEFTSTSKQYIFASNRKSTVKAAMRCYYCKLWLDGVLVRDFIPCYRKSDGVIGMYDLCGSVCSLTGSSLYTNSGTGAFTKGADV